MTLSARQDVRSALALLGIAVDDLVHVESELGRLSPDLAAEVLKTFRQRVHRAFRNLSKTHHPDVTAGDEAKAAAFREAKAFDDWCQKWQVVKRPRASARILMGTSGLAMEVHDRSMGVTLVIDLQRFMERAYRG